MDSINACVPLFGVRQRPVEFFPSVFGRWASGWVSGSTPPHRGFVYGWGFKKVDGLGLGKVPPHPWGWPNESMSTAVVYCTHAGLSYSIVPQSCALGRFSLRPLPKVTDEAPALPHPPAPRNTPTPSVGVSQASPPRMRCS